MQVFLQRYQSFPRALITQLTITNNDSRKENFIDKHFLWKAFLMKSISSYIGHPIIRPLRSTIAFHYLKAEIWGRYSRGRYLCTVTGVEVAIGSAAAISKVVISNGHVVRRNFFEQCTIFYLMIYYLLGACIIQTFLSAAIGQLNRFLWPLLLLLEKFKIFEYIFKAFQDGQNHFTTSQIGLV